MHAHVSTARAGGEVTFSGINGVGLVVAGPRDQTACARIGRSSTSKLKRVVVAGTFHHATWHRFDACSVVVGRVVVVVDGQRVCATRNFIEVAHAVAVVVQTNAVAVKACEGEFTGAAVDRIGVVVARLLIQAAHARFKVARSVVHVGLRVKVAGSAKMQPPYSQPWSTVASGSKLSASGSVQPT